MELGDQRLSGNVEDRRGMGIGVGGGLGIGGVVIPLIPAFLGVDPTPILNTVQESRTQGDTREAPRGAPPDTMGQFVSKRLGRTEDVWGQFFKQSGGT